MIIPTVNKNSTDRPEYRCSVRPIFMLVLIGLLEYTIRPNYYYIVIIRPNRVAKRSFLYDFLLVAPPSCDTQLR